jgi:hypothetical protein
MVGKVAENFSFDTFFDSKEKRFFLFRIFLISESFNCLLSRRAL